MRPEIFVISDAGDPANPGTWSGTPYNLLEALRNVGCDATPLNLTPKRSLQAVMAAISLATGNGREFRRTKICTLYAKLARGVLAQENAVYLHTTTSTILPAKSKTNVARHAIYLDSTFHLMSEHSLNPYNAATFRRYDKFEAEAVRAADFLFTASECAARNLIEHYAIPSIKVAAVGTGLGKIKASAGEKVCNTKTILFVAKQRFLEKGGQLLLDGFRLCHSVDAGLRLIVVATEEYRRMIEAVPGAIFKSNLPWTELEFLFNTSSLYAMPAFFEPWGLVYLEALACKTPILGLNRNAFPEISNSGRCGFAVDEATPTAVATALIDAFSDLDRLAQMGVAGQRYVQSRYSWNKAATRMLEKLFGNT